MAMTEQVCFDRILPHHLLRPHVGRIVSLSIGPCRAAFPISKLWANGSTLAIRFLGGTPRQQAMVKQYAMEWLDYANLEFAFKNAPHAQVRIAFAEEGAWSYIGTDALSIPANQPTMNFSWLDQGIILHEFGHLIGMIHEHHHPPHNPIQWNKPVVNAALSGPPNYWDQATIDHHMYAQYAISQMNESDFNPESIMLYSFPSRWTLNDVHPEPNDTLSTMDKVCAQRMYPFSGPGSITEPIDLPVFERVTEGEIRPLGAEDLYKFTAKSPGRYSIEVEGPADLVMKLYGPHSGLIAQDEGSRVRGTPRISTELTPGVYTIQVRHYNTTDRTGKYAITVSKE